jgi:flagellar hook-associated protein 3 FlgL
MRVTDSMVYMNMQRNVAQRQQDYVTAQQRATTGKKVNAPSDDPWAFAQARYETGNLARAQSYERTIDMAKPSLQTTDSTLTSVENVIQRVRDIAVESANDTYNGGDRNTFSQELDTLRDQLVSLGNTHTGDRYIFAGYKDGAPPYDATGVYSGDTQTAQVEIARGVNLPLGVTGDQVFGAAGDDVFSTIQKLQTALTTGTTSDVSSMITEIDTRYEQVRNVHSEIGNQLNSADIATSVAQRAQDTATANKSDLVDIDTVKAYTDLTRATTALQAAIQIAGQLPPPGLVSRGG